ncbi:alpha-galactosidase [Paenibacillus sp. UNCCL117]|uniref:family 4 glycosyl hydrolase n=1 Tax=unclassified Paenibacillus TaxID=185978 RepID=UPI0008832486|nr:MULTISPECIES: glycoside hydrolase family 4 [unclassified Paenibacillus]SDD03873.1 alpha-galactosidase [Paenibacillus sp. cl123]SFW32210.1 alpha-galactosidase [Paenibacillus sp. UNCCL117]
MKEPNIERPKVVVIGAGSLFFGRQAIWQMVQSPYLNKGTLSFVDTDEQRLEKMVTLARMVAEANHVELRVEGSANRRDVLPGADFVILSFAKDTVKYRGIDCAVSEKYGIRMCSGDTIGPGGIFRAMREFPVILECAKDIEELCSDAWVINYINPSAVHGIGMKRYAPSLKSFALCDSQHLPHIKQRYAVRAGIVAAPEELTEELSRRFDFRIAGVNHFTWLLKADYDGKDMSERIAESMRADARAEKETLGGDTGAKAIFNHAISYELYSAFGRIPTCTGHTKEYVRFWQGLGTGAEGIPPLSIWETEERYKRHEQMWEQVDDFISGRLPIESYMDSFAPDHATDIIENMVGNLGKPFYINTFNEGAVSNMNRDAFLELCCDTSLEGVKPYPVGDMPRGIRGMCELILDTHELTAEAIAERSFAKLRRAMLTDPLVNSIGDADRIIKELLEQERDALPAWWYE